MEKKSTTKKGQANKKAAKKKNYTNIAIVAVVGVACIGMILINNYLNKSKETSEGGNVTPEVTMTPAVEITPTKMPEPTPTVELTITPEPTAQPELTTEAEITEERATEIVKNAIADDTYHIECMDKQLTIDGNSYYEFHIKRENAVMEPLILVSKKDGTIYYYDKAGTILTFTKFPLDNVENVGKNEDVIEKNDAISRVEKIPRATLGLEKELSQYIIEMDEWTTVVNRESCYCLNVFEQNGDSKQLVAVYYVSVDGTNVYRLDEESQEFEKI